MPKYEAIMFPAPSDVWARVGLDARPVNMVEAVRLYRAGAKAELDGVILFPTVEGAVEAIRQDAMGYGSLPVLIRLANTTQG